MGDREACRLQQYGLVAAVETLHLERGVLPRQQPHHQGERAIRLTGRWLALPLAVRASNPDLLDRIGLLEQLADHERCQVRGHGRELQPDLGTRRRRRFGNRTAIERDRAGEQRCALRHQRHRIEALAEVRAEHGAHS